MKLKHITTNTLLALLFTASLMAQQSKDPYTKGEKLEEKTVAKKQAVDDNPTHTIVFETFSLSLKEAAELMRSGKTDEQLYASLMQKGKQEGLVVMRGRSGEKTFNEAVHELIYPTEYDAPEIPNSVGVQISSEESKEKGKSGGVQTENLSKAPDAKSLSGLRTPASPTAFETRNVGVTVEIEFTVSHENKGRCDMRIAPEMVNYIGERISGQGLSETKMPEFETQRLQAGVTLDIGKPYLLGTMNRPPSSRLDGDLPNKVWFAMISITPVKK